MNVLCFGEILYDCIGEEKKLGGAPLNVAGHIAQMGGKVAVVSAVGKDEDGINAINEMERLNVSSEFVEKREEGTGKAIVVLSDGIPDYSFTEPSAWDYIEESKLDKEALLTSSFDAFVFGTLASRREISIDAVAQPEPVDPNTHVSPIDDMINPDNPNSMFSKYVFSFSNNS